MSLKIPRLPAPPFLLLFLGLVFCFYVWTGLTTPSTHYYSLLADALLHGQTSILLKPPKELLELPDPYELEQYWKVQGLYDAAPYSGKYQLFFGVVPFRALDGHVSSVLTFGQDATLYKGKFYLYFGIVPAIVLFIPILLIFGQFFPDSIAVIVFGFSGLVFAVFLLRFLTRTYFPKTPAWIFLLAVASLSFSNVIPFILRRPAYAEAAVAGGYCFLLGAFYFLTKGILQGVTGRRWYWLGSLFLGLAVGSRPNLILVVPLLGLVWLKGIFEAPNHSIAFWAHVKSKMLAPQHIKDAIALFFPLLTCIGLLGLYNYIRFGDWTEFGVHYQLPGVPVNMRQVHFGNFFGFCLNFVVYLFLPLNLDSLFPFFHVLNVRTYLPGNIYWAADGMVGILISTPVLLLLFLLPSMLVRGFVDIQKRTLNWMMGALVIQGVIIFLFTSYYLPGALLRYQVDFASLLLLPALLVWFYIYEQQNKKTGKYAIFQGEVVFLILYGCLVGLAISISGPYGAPYDLLRLYNPEIYHALERFFSF